MKRLKAIRNTATWQERLAIAQNEKPGTEFDGLFNEAARALKLIEMKKMDKEGEAWLTQIGRYFADLFTQRNGGQILHEMADALNTWHGHSRYLTVADRIRCQLIALDGMFPAGKPRLVTVSDGKAIYGKPYSTLTNACVIDSLRAKGLVITDDNMPSILREIRRQANKLNIRLDSKPGARGKSQPGQKR